MSIFILGVLSAGKISGRPLGGGLDRLKFLHLEAHMFNLLISDSRL